MPSQSVLTEKDMLDDLLNQEKQMMASYAASLQEASCKNLRKLLSGHFNQASQDQYELFDRMREKGYYQPRGATGQAVQQVKNAYKNTQNELSKS